MARLIEGLEARVRAGFKARGLGQIGNRLIRDLRVQESSGLISPGERQRELNRLANQPGNQSLNDLPSKRDGSVKTNSIA